ncbi:MAG: T9SS type A sorting domain-containing protein [Mesonia sp.]|uniref:T9SS type A sorting domain-containing protein n=1 Tax=Mesonia sp. TaxID=1960830 RepID=UPI003F9721FA
MKNITLIFFSLFISNIVAQTDPFPYERDWSTYYGPYATRAISSTMDSGGNVYILSVVEASGLETEAAAYTTPGVHQTTYGGGGSDVFISKFDSEGNLVWATFFGGEGGDWATDIVWDNNNIYIVGSTNSTTGIATSNSFQESMVDSEPITIPRYTAGYLAKFSETGELTWATYIDGERLDGISAVAVENGEIVIGGIVNSTMHLTTPESFQQNVTFTDVDNQRVGLLMKFDENGTRLWGTYYGAGETNEGISSVSINSSENIFIVGTSNNDSGYYATSGAYQPQNNGATDLFISKFSPSGSRIWSTYYGGEAEETIGNTAFNIVAARNSIFLTAYTESSTNIATNGAFQQNLIGNQSPLLAKFDTLTGNLLWGTYFGTTVLGQYATFSAHLNLNLETNELWLSGHTTSPSNISTPGAYQEELNPFSSGSNTDGYFAKFSQDGSLVFASYYGGDKMDEIVNVLPAVYEDNFYLVGFTSSENAIATTDGYQPQLPAGNYPTNSFLVKFVPEGLGVDDLSISKFSLWPNPTAGQFAIQGTNQGEMQLSLYDTGGRKIFSQSKVKVGKSINLSDKLPSGMYFLKLDLGPQKIQVLKLIIK